MYVCGSVRVCVCVYVCARTRACVLLYARVVCMRGVVLCLLLYIYRRMSI